MKLARFGLAALPGLPPIYATATRLGASPLNTDICHRHTPTKPPPCAPALGPAPP